MYQAAEQIDQLIKAARKIVVLQADNPDADSLGSALALEHILGDMDKEVTLYCAVDVPAYLRYLPGWDRVSSELPKQFDASIVVDASTMTLFEKLARSDEKNWLAAKPCIVLDHHEKVENPIGFATVTINDHGRSSAGELIYALAKQLGWKVSAAAGESLMASILGDTQGLTNQLAHSGTYRIMAELIDGGADRPKLEEVRRELSKMPPEIFRYKAELIKRTELAADGQIAWVSVPQDEIKRFSPLYNPAPLIQADMLQTAGVRLAIVFKTYDDGRITAAIRANPGAGVAAQLAEHFGGGGHAFASGFKVTDDRNFADINKECLRFAQDLLDKAQQVLK